MKRSERLLDLVTLLGGRRRVTLRDIVRRFEVSERTAYRDLADLGRDLAPVVRDEGGYRLMDGAVLRPLNLDAAERALLAALLARRPIERLPPLADRLRTLAAKLEAASGRRPAARPVLALSPLDRSGPIAAGTLRTLETALDAQRTCLLDYRSLTSGSRRHRRADPWALVHRGAWYLVAHCHERHAPRLFRLDRVLAVEATADTFERPPDFDLDTYLADSWEVFRGDDSHQVTIRFAPELAALVFHGRHHAGETVEQEPDGSALYRVTLSHLEEVARWVVGFGGRAVALAPEGLVERVREMAEGALAAAQTPGSGETTS